MTAEFAEVIKKTELYTNVPFKLDGPFTELYFGKERTRAISYSEFSQFLHGKFNFFKILLKRRIKLTLMYLIDFHEECALEAFKLKDPNRSGYITALDFQYIMLKVKGHLLTTAAKDNLIQV